MIEEIRQEAIWRGITRLCHFTPSRNLQHIAAGNIGVLSTDKLSAEERSAFNPSDLERFDGHTGHICCSIEYPNGWYFEKARDRDPVFPDWVVLLISPDALWADSTLFCPRNAATGHGRLIAAGFEAFQGLFAPTVGSGEWARRRSPRMFPSCPTDQQAEALVADRIPMKSIIGVAVRDERQALTEMARLRVNGLDADQFKFVAAPTMFRKYDLSQAILNGIRPNEVAVGAEIEGGEAQ